MQWVTYIEMSNYLIYVESFLKIEQQQKEILLQFLPSFTTTTINNIEVHF